MNNEFHLFIVWENARYKEKEIIDDLRKIKKLNIVEAYEILWNQNNIASNYSRFYGEKLEDMSHKIKEYGTGRFLLIIVRDENPCYSLMETSKGYKNVNVNLFTLKTKYRSWTGGGSKIHATNTPEETRHDLVLLLGRSYEDYIKTAPEYWDDSYKQHHHDLTGCNGWTSLQELFYVLNDTHDYVVLRNDEQLPDIFKTELHGDIDILVRDENTAAGILNAKKVIQDPNRVQYANFINNEKVLWDIRSIGDDYYCRKWEENIINTRIKNNNHIYVPDAKNFFYSLVYHAILHKETIADDYYEKAGMKFKEASLDAIDQDGSRNVFGFYFDLLKKFMLEHNYPYTRPKDYSVYFNEKIIDDDITTHLEKEYSLTKIKSIISCHGGGGYIYFQGYLNKTKLFIKWGGTDMSCKNEFIFSRILHKINPVNFPVPFFYECDKNKKFIAFRYIEGETLKSVLSRKIDDKTKENIVFQLEIIAKNLMEAKCIHRDIHPENILVDRNGNLIVIDAQWACHYTETTSIRKIHGPNNEYTARPYHWDDMYSINRILEEIQPPVSCTTASDYIRSHIGKMSVSIPRKYILKHLIKRKIIKLLISLIPHRRTRKKMREHYLYNQQ